MPSSYIQDNYSQLHNHAQGDMSVDEYTREIEKLLIKCNIKEPEEKMIVRYLGGLEPKYSNIIESQQYSTFEITQICFTMRLSVRPLLPLFSLSKLEQASSLGGYVNFDIRAQGL